MSSLYHCLNDDLRALTDRIFTAMPQNPHFQPLEEKFSSAGIREGIKFGFDLAFINLADQLKNNPHAFLSSEVQNECVLELTVFEEMGYDCNLMWGRFDDLRAMAERVEMIKVKKDDLVSDLRDKRVKLDISKTRVSDAKAELKKLEDVCKNQMEEVERVEFEVRSLGEKREEIVGEFNSAAQPW